MPPQESKMDVEERRRLSIERRRARNRAAMQRFRQRERDRAFHLQQTAHALSVARDDLVQDSSVQLMLALEPASFAPTAAPLLDRIDEAKLVTKSLLEEKARLQEALVVAIKWEDRVRYMLNDIGAQVCDNMQTPFIAPPIRLTSTRASEIIAFNREKRRAIQRVLVASTSMSSQFFGWDVRYCFQREYVHVKFIKSFRNASAANIARSAWRNARKLRRYITPRQPPQLVQKIDKDTFVDARVSSEKYQSPRVTYNLRFIVKEPDGVIGIGTQTLPQFSGDAAEAADREPDHSSCIDLCLFIKLTPKLDDDGQEDCLVEFSGRAMFDRKEDSRRRALEMMISLVRWEEMNVGSSSTRQLS